MYEYKTMRFNNNSGNDLYKLNVCTYELASRVMKQKRKKEKERK